MFFPCSLTKQITQFLKKNKKRELDQVYAKSRKKKKDFAKPASSLAFFFFFLNDATIVVSLDFTH